MTFRDALIARLEEPNAQSLKQVAEGSGVSYEALKKVKQGRSASTNADDAIKIARYYGLTLDEFVDDSLPSERAELARLYSGITAEERQILLDAARGRAARSPRSSD